jgi:PKD repeat protein
MPAQDGPFSMAFDARSSVDADGQIVGYSWDFGDGTSEQGAQVTHTFPQSGTYSVKLFVTDDRGNTGAATATVTLLDPQKNSTPTASFVVSSLRDVSPVAVALDASGSFDLDGAIGQYLWDFGDGRGGSGRTTSHEYDQSGTYIVSLTITDNAGATASLADTIDVRFELPEFLDLFRVGSTRVRGYAEYQGDVLMVESQGSFGTTEEDAFAYVYSPLSGDGEIVARVVSMETTEAWASTGVMIREKLSATSRFVAMVMTDEYGGSFQQRSAPGTVGARQTPGVGWLPYWVRLERKNNKITGYTSIDGQRWAVMGQAEMDMASDVYIGVAVASNADSVLTTSSVDQIFIESTEPEPVEIPTEYELSEIYPNPFNPQAQFSLILSQEEEVTIQLFDALGRHVRTLAAGPLAPETRHEFVIDASGLTSGLYIMRATGESFEQVRKAILLK